MGDQRADTWLVAKGFAPTRSQAKDLIRRKKVLFQEKVLEKAGTLLPEDAEIRLLETHQYVSRSARKLLGMLDMLSLELPGRIAVDLGASTGGFTQVLLEKGCEKVYAIDVGQDQLAEALRNHPQVVNMEGVNARHPISLPEPTDLVVADLSFISLRLVWETIKQLVGPEGDAVVLVKPQFEAGKGGVNQRGVVKDREVAKRIVQDLLGWGQHQGLYPWHVMPSEVIGKKGNHEFLVHLRPHPCDEPLPSSWVKA